MEWVLKLTLLNKMYYSMYKVRKNFVRKNVQPVVKSLTNVVFGHFCNLKDVQLIGESKGNSPKPWDHGTATPEGFVSHYILGRLLVEILAEPRMEGRPVEATGVIEGSWVAE